MQDIYENITDQEYHSLLDLLMLNADMVSFVTRTDIGINHHKKSIVEAFKPYLLEDYKINSWYSTEVKSWKKVGHVYYFDFNDETLLLLKKVSSSLFEWGESNHLPENIAFFDKKKNPILIVNGHENYFIIYDDFVEKFARFNENLPKDI